VRGSAILPFRGSLVEPPGPHPTARPDTGGRPAAAAARILAWVRHRLPQPYEDLGHTADVGIRVRGASCEEALARLALAFGTLVTGGEPAAPVREERLEVPGGPDLAGTAVALLRELLFRLATTGELPAEVEVLSASEAGAVATVGFGRHDPERHAEGADVKAVTRHAARLEREGDGWVAQVVLDV
jgi:SHS2 domain-containing protein